jgi:hypothetical protein
MCYLPELSIVFLLSTGGFCEIDSVSKQNKIDYLDLLKSSQGHKGHLNRDSIDLLIPQQSILFSLTKDDLHDYSVVNDFDVDYAIASVRFVMTYIDRSAVFAVLYFDRIRNTEIQLIYAVGLLQRGIHVKKTIDFIDLSFKDPDMSIVIKQLCGPDYEKFKEKFKEIKKTYY